MVNKMSRKGNGGAMPSAKRYASACGTFERLSDNRLFELKGRPAEALYALVRVGPHGLTAAEVSNWALRLAAYVKTLRDLGFLIDTISEKHAGGSHGRYVLRTGVRVHAYTPASLGG